MFFRYTILYVDDVPQQMDLYERGFGLEPTFLHPSNEYGEFATGETRLAFSSRELMRRLGKTPDRAQASRPVFEIAFEVAPDDVASTYTRALEAGFEPVQRVREEAWGQLTSYVADPNEGFLIEICSPVVAQS